MSHGHSPLTKITVMGRIIEELYPIKGGIPCVQLTDRLNNGACPKLPPLRKHGIKNGYVKSLLNEMKRKGLVALGPRRGSSPRLWKVNKGSSSMDIWRK